MLAGLALVAGTIAIASFAVKPNKAQAFTLFYGSVFLNDERAPVAVDLTNGKATVRLVDANTQVSAKKPSDLDVIPLTNATLLLNAASGEFNMVDPTGFVIKTKNGGVPLPKRTGATTSIGIAAGPAAYVVQTGPDGTSAYLVNQATVQAATADVKVKPRAYITMPEPGSSAHGSAASANGELWLLVGSGPSRTLRQLSLPPASDAGVTLHSADRATVTSLSAIGVARNPAGRDVVAVATPDQLHVFDGASPTRTISLGGLSGVDRILPASNQDDRLSFLYHSTAGWSLVSAPAGSGKRVEPVTLGIDPSAELVAPAASNGSLFTMDTGATGRVWQIGAGGAVQTPAGAAKYPVIADSSGNAQEVTAFGDAYAIARGDRVIFDSPNHVQALALFTDDSHKPVLIDKSAAVSLDAKGDATALAGAHAPKKPSRAQPPAGQAAKAPQAQPIDDKIRCKTSTQVPHIPTIAQAVPGSRSAQLTWTYPLLDPRDCRPSTYRVSVKLDSSSAPSPPSDVTVQGQDGVNLTGLFPNTRYEITVSAYLNGHGTPSSPVEILTGPEGPAAPTKVHTSADDSGNWIVTWNSCGGVAQGCVPATSWNVIPDFCDGSGLSSVPATISVAGDPTQHSFTATFPGEDSRLGRGLSFQVEGLGIKDTVGTPGADHACTYSWSRPVASNISVVASSPPMTTGQADSSTTVAVSFTGSQIHDLGGAGGQLTYQLLSGGSVIDKKGPLAATTASLAGILPGQRYQVAVVVSPPRHPEAGVTVGPVDVQAATAVWPALSVSTSFVNTSAFDGTLIVQMDGVSRAASRGEVFDLSNSSLDCGETHLALDHAPFDPAHVLRFPRIQRAQYNGPCTVSVQLIQDPRFVTDPPVYGAGASQRATSSPVEIDTPSLTGGENDFAAAWTDQSTRASPQVVVSYDGADPLLLTYATGWSMIVSNNAGTTSCGTSAIQPPAVIAVSQACTKAGGTFSVAISFGYFGRSFTYRVAVSGTVPRPIDPAKINFVTKWNAALGPDKRPQVFVRTSGSLYDDETLASLNWTETVTSSSSPRVVCGRGFAPPTAGGINISVNPKSCPAKAKPATAWTVTISYTDPGTDGAHTYVRTVTGVEPK